jgi:hypothetical protein
MTNSLHLNRNCIDQARLSMRGLSPTRLSDAHARWAGFAALLGSAFVLLAVAGCGGAPSMGAPESPTASTDASPHDDPSSGVRIAHIEVSPAADDLDGVATKAADPTPIVPPLVENASKPKLGGKHATASKREPPDGTKTSAGGSATGSPGGGATESGMFGGGAQGEHATPAAATTTSLGVELSEDDVNQAIAPKMRSLRSCASTDSSISMRLAVAPGGKVAEATATRSMPDDPRLRDCVERNFRGVTFGASSRDHGTALSFELELKPLDAR